MIEKSSIFTTAYWDDRIPHISETIYQIKSEEVEECKKSAIQHNGISILPLLGQELTTNEVLEDNLFWETDPYPNFESRLLYYNFSALGSKASLFGGEQKLWKRLNKAVKNLKEEQNIGLDILNLTPTEAIQVVKEVIRQNLNYDDLLAGYINDESIANQEVKTGKPQILSHYESNPKKFQTLSNWYSTSMSLKSADKILDHGYAICTHTAAISSILYEVLRSKQESVLMNGSYLLYHDESFKDQFPKSSVGAHAFNILYVSHPTKESKIEVSLSVLDPTYALGKNIINSDIDFTPGRLSQACSSLFEYGHYFNVHQDTVTHLADQAAIRVKKLLLDNSPIFAKTDLSFYTTNHISDFASLVFQGTPGKNGQSLEEIYDIYKAKNRSRAYMLESLFTMPPLTYNSNSHTRKLTSEWVPEVLKQLEKIDFTQSTEEEKAVFIFLEHFAKNISPIQHKYDKDGNFKKLISSYNQISQTVKSLKAL